jgi:hypothetical protein
VHFHPPKGSRGGDSRTSNGSSGSQTPGGGGLQVDACLSQGVGVGDGELHEHAVARCVDEDDLHGVVGHLAPLAVSLRLFHERVRQRLDDDHVHALEDAGTRPLVLDQVLHVSQPAREPDGLAERLVLVEELEVFVVQTVFVRRRAAVADDGLAEPLVEGDRPDGDGGHVLQVLRPLVLQVDQPGGAVDDHEVEQIFPAARSAVLDQVVTQQSALGQSDDPNESVVAEVSGVVVDCPKDVLLAVPAVGRQLDRQFVAVFEENGGDEGAGSLLRGSDAVDVDGQDIRVLVGGLRGVHDLDRPHQPISLLPDCRRCTCI